VTLNDLERRNGFYSRINIRVGVRVRVRFMVSVREKCLGGEMSRGNFRHSKILGDMSQF